MTEGWAGLGMVKGTACGVNIAVFGYVTQAATVDMHQQFVGTCYLHLQAILPSR